jgi:Tfp pilus assembly protein PilF
MPSRLAATALLAALALGATACGGDDHDQKPSEKQGQKASTAAVDTLVQHGLDQLNDGQTAAAQGTFENVLSLEADNVYAHYNLGFIAQQAGHDGEARKQYDAALAVDPTFGSALYNKGILTEGDDLEAAVTLYRQVISSEPDFAPAHMRLGFALLQLGQKAEGEKELADGIRLDPSMKDVEAPSYR